MSELRDFDLNVKEVGNEVSDDDKLTSKFACTPGCVTGWLMTCNNKSKVSCNVSVIIPK